MLTFRDSRGGNGGGERIFMHHVANDLTSNRGGIGHSRGNDAPSIGWIDLAQLYHV